MSNLKKYDLVELDQVKQFSSELQKFIGENQLSTTIAGSQHAHVEAWSFAGMSFGLDHRIRETIKISEPSQRLVVYYRETTKTYQGRQTTKDVPYLIDLINSGDPLPPHQQGHKRHVVKPYCAYKSTCDIFQGDKLISTGDAFCSNMEQKKLEFDEYAVLSMAQTRSVGKAYRLRLGFVFKLSGYSPTPAEEMQEDHFKNEVNQEPVKKMMNAKQWESFKKRFESGEDILQDTRSIFTLTQEQEDWISKKV